MYFPGDRTHSQPGPPLPILPHHRTGHSGAAKLQWEVQSQKYVDMSSCMLYDMYVDMSSCMQDTSLDSSDYSNTSEVTSSLR